MKQIQDIKAIGGRSEKKRVGRGGDRGKTSGRGTKGQKARAGHRIRPEIRDFIKKLPKRRGYGKNRAQAVNNSIPDATVVSIAKLEKFFNAGDTVSRQTLVDTGAVSKKLGKFKIVKILGGTEKDVLTKKLTIDGVAISAGAKAMVEKVGGTVIAYIAPVTQKPKVAKVKKAAAAK
jgi:large subunit ribosomal protein L15